jgi:hypothetical protein
MVLRHVQRPPPNGLWRQLHTHLCSNSLSHTNTIADWDDGGGGGPLSDDETDYMPLPDAAEPGLHDDMFNFALCLKADQRQSCHHSSVVGSS